MDDFVILRSRKHKIDSEYAEYFRIPESIYMTLDYAEYENKDEIDVLLNKQYSDIISIPIPKERYMKTMDVPISYKQIRDIIKYYIFFLEAKVDIIDKFLETNPTMSLNDIGFQLIGNSSTLKYYVPLKSSIDKKYNIAREVALGLFYNHPKNKECLSVNRRRYCYIKYSQMLAIIRKLQRSKDNPY